MLKNPNYFKKDKGKKCKIVYMSPDQYMKEVAKQQKTSMMFQYEVPVMQSKLQRIRDYIKAGNKLPLLYIENTEHCHTQEGRHRAIVAKELGLKKIPVLVVTEMSVPEWESFMKKNYPEVWKYMS